MFLTKLKHQLTFQEIAFLQITTFRFPSTFVEWILADGFLLFCFFLLSSQLCCIDQHFLLKCSNDSFSEMCCILDGRKKKRQVLWTTFDPPFNQISNFYFTFVSACFLYVLFEIVQALNILPLSIYRKICSFSQLVYYLFWLNPATISTFNFKSTNRK
jgi:hypothetical protein